MGSFNEKNMSNINLESLNGYKEVNISLKIETELQH